MASVVAKVLATYVGVGAAVAVGLTFRELDGQRHDVLTSMLVPVVIVGISALWPVCAVAVVFDGVARVFGSRD